MRYGFSNSPQIIWRELDARALRCEQSLNAARRQGSRFGECVTISRKRLWSISQRVFLPIFYGFVWPGKFGFLCLSPFLSTYSSGCPPAVLIWKLIFPISSSNSSLV